MPPFCSRRSATHCRQSAVHSLSRKSSGISLLRHAQHDNIMALMPKRRSTSLRVQAGGKAARWPPTSGFHGIISRTVQLANSVGRVLSNQSSALRSTCRRMYLPREARTLASSRRAVVGKHGHYGVSVRKGQALRAARRPPSLTPMRRKLPHELEELVCETRHLARDRGKHDSGGVGNLQDRRPLSLVAQKSIGGGVFPQCHNLLYVWRALLVFPGLGHQLRSLGSPIPQGRC